MGKKDDEVQFLESIASTLRAIAGGTEHEVVFLGDTPHIGNDKVRLPKLNDIKTDGSRLRGEADKIALWIKHHNPKLDQAYAPKGTLQKEIYDSAEYARVEALGSLYMPGISTNIDSQIIHKNKNEPEIILMFNEIISEIKKIELKKKIESLEDKVSLNLDENLYSELLSLRNQLKRG